MEAGEPVVIPNAEGARTTPSIVAINKSGERLVGEVAKRQAITNPENTVYSIKRFMGRKYGDAEVDRDKRLVPYKVVKAPNGDAWVEVQGKAYSPPEISAMILQKLKADAEAYLGERVTQAVITTPAYFNDAQRQVTRDSGKIAGLEVMRIINEPTAASLAYGLDRKKDERIAVYDLGGGTFDISILELGDGVFEVKSTNGDTHLGGDDFDQRIITWLADEFRKESGIDLRQDRMALQRLKEAAEKAKKELSSSMQTEVNLPFITADASGPKHLTMTLTRSKLEQLVEDLIEKSRKPVMQALADASVRPGDIQPSVEINVLQGEREFAKDNRSLGSFILDGIPPAPRGVPQIEVTFDIDANGIVNVSARDKGTGREQKIAIVASSGLSKDQIDKMVRDAEAHAADDKRRKEEVEERNLADSAAYRAEKSMTELGDKLTPEQKSELEARIADVNAALSTEDVERIKSARESLEQTFHKISEIIYSQAGASSAPGTDFGGSTQETPTDQGSPNDDTIEGEYKEM